jgi:hypothetical protein
MFRNALRQTTRAVGAVSAAGRVTAVSLLTAKALQKQPQSPTPSSRDLRRPLFIDKKLRTDQLSLWLDFWQPAPAFSSFLGAPRLSAALLRSPQHFRGFG